MRRVLNNVAAVAVVLAVAGSAFALPREGRDEERDREPAIVKMVKKIARALGDGLIVPLP